MGRIPVPAHAEVITATLVVQVVVKTAKLPILKANSDETSPPGHRRCHDFHDNTQPPLFITLVTHLIANTEEKSLSFTEVLRRLGVLVVILRDETGRCGSGVYVPLRP